MSGRWKHTASLYNEEKKCMEMHAEGENMQGGGGADDEERKGRK